MVAETPSVIHLARRAPPYQPQRGFVTQPSVGAKRLRWVNGQKEATLKELKNAAADWM